jgi:hypothetical protein
MRHFGTKPSSLVDNKNVSNTCILVGPCRSTTRNLHVFNRAIRIQERRDVTTLSCKTQKTKVCSKAPSVSVSVIFNTRLVSFFCLASGIFRQLATLATVRRAKDVTCDVLAFLMTF